MLRRLLGIKKAEVEVEAEAEVKIAPTPYDVYDSEIDYQKCEILTDDELEMNYPEVHRKFMMRSGLCGCSHPEYPGKMFINAEREGKL